MKNIKKIAHYAIWTCLVGFLSACASSTAPVFDAVYDLGIAPTTTQTASTKPILLASVQSNQALDSTAILYRLSEHNAQQLQPYTQSHWAMPAPQLLHQRLRQQLGQHRAVLQSNQGVTAPAGTLRLHWEIEEFSQWFESKESSKAVVRVVVTLGRMQSGNKEEFVAQRNFSAQAPAPTANAAGGVLALTQATDSLINDITRWVENYQSL